MIEFALNFLPVQPHNVITPVDDAPLNGVRFGGKIVGVSIIRAGEAMENALRSCCRNVRLGKILVQRDHQARPKFYMAKLPVDVAERHVLLMDPMLATGGSASVAIEKLLENGVNQDNIIFVNVVAAPEGVQTLLDRFPNIQICTGKVAEGLNCRMYIKKSVGDFGDRYFGTEAIVQKDCETNHNSLQEKPVSRHGLSAAKQKVTDGMDETGKKI